MKMSGNTILITGGTSGIGFELARQLSPANTVIITGRDEGRLAAARSKLGNVHTRVGDVSDARVTGEMGRSLTQEFPGLNIVINNAGIMRKISLHGDENAVPDIAREIETNLSGPIRLTQQLIPHLKQRASAAIVNITSGLAFVPFPISPIYSATKAGLRAYTRVLRLQMRNTKIRVFEVAPPGTETPTLSR